MRKHMDAPTTIVAALTLAMFVAALFVKGFTHDLFLEAAVFLVSVKVFMMIHDNRIAVSRLEEKLDAVLSALRKESDSFPPSSH